MNRLFVSAAHKSSGKTTITIGLCAALSSRAMRVQPFKKGPDYIDPMWLGLASNRPCHNLDFFLTQNDEIVETVRSRSIGSDIAIIEGNKGLYDGLDLDGSNSNAALAKLLGTPVVLVIDARGMTRGIAPLILGYQSFDRNVRIAGVILNQLGGARHERKLRAVIEHYTDVPVVGAVQHEASLEIVERHLGLVPSNEASAARARIAAIGDAIGKQVDLDRIARIAATADALPNHPTPAITVTEPASTAPPVRIGIARDAAFAFYYPADLESLERHGATLVPFDTLRDSQLPNVDALLIGGGFPETHMGQLESNRDMRSAIRTAIEQGMPVYAECGGLMYLSRSLAWKGETRQMVGAIPADTIMHARPQGRGYVRLKDTPENPWPRAGKPSGQDEIPAHEFHYSSLVNVDPGVRFAYQVTRGTGIDGKHDGLIHRNVLACYTHMRDVGGNHWTARFVEFVRNVQHQVRLTTGQNRNTR